ncbi:DUF5808 domain-containing protein [Streptosporangium soli]|nr:DUF5808 domain-containing protein [Streptosporangium sp. KLBMP 9127]
MIMQIVHVVLVTAVAWMVPRLTRPELPFGVRVPPGRVDDPAVTGHRAAYRRRVALLGALAVPVTAVLTTTVVPTALTLADALLYYTAYRSIRAAKHEGRWYAGERQATTADTTLRTDPIRVPWPWLAPAVLLLLGTAATGAWQYGRLPATLATIDGFGIDTAQREPTTLGNAFAPVIAQLAITLIMPLVVVSLLRARPDLDAADPAGSARRFRVYLGGVARLSFFTTACLNLSMLLVVLGVWDLLPLPAVVPHLPWVLALAAWLGFEMRVGHAGHRLPAAEGAEPARYVQRDDDRYWHLAGLIYLNRDDPVIFVHQRLGVAWTMNLGHPVTWVTLGLLAVLLLLAATGVIDLPAR